MKIERRLERLEQAYFPDSKRRGYYLEELLFVHAFFRLYKGHEDSAPTILLDAFRLIQKRPRR